MAMTLAMHLTAGCLVIGVVWACNRGEFALLRRDVGPWWFLMMMLGSATYWPLWLGIGLGEWAVLRWRCRKRC